MINPFIKINIFIIISTILALIIATASYIISPKTLIIEKLLPYECGFEPFADARNNFEIHFIVIAILFLIFDIEILFLYPWSFDLFSISFMGLWGMFYFLYILLIGFYYEWKKGALTWIKKGCNTKNSCKKLTKVGNNSVFIVLLSSPPLERLWGFLKGLIEAAGGGFLRWVFIMLEEDPKTLNEFITHWVIIAALTIATNVFLKYIFKKLVLSGIRLQKKGIIPKGIILTSLFSDKNRKYIILAPYFFLFFFFSIFT